MGTIPFENYSSEDQISAIEEITGIEVIQTCLDDEHFLWYQIIDGEIDQEAGVDDVMDLFTKEQQDGIVDCLNKNY